VVPSFFSVAVLLRGLMWLRSHKHCIDVVSGIRRKLLDFIDYMPGADDTLNELPHHLPASLSDTRFSSISIDKSVHSTIGQVGSSWNCCWSYYTKCPDKHKRGRCSFTENNEKSASFAII